MNISKETQAALEQVLGQRLTERRLKDWLKTVTPPERGIGSEDCTDSPPPPAEYIAKARALITQASQKLPSTNPKPVASLDAAATMLLGIMEDAHVDVIKDVAHENNWPIWAVMLGAVARAADNRELNASDMNPDWINEPEKVEGPKAVVTCESCHLDIPGARRGQRFCCSAHGSEKDWHSPGCPAAVAAGIDTQLAAPVAEEPKKDTEVALVATGTCHHCHHPILNGRASQLYCCSGCGCSTAHSATCETGKALAGQSAEA